MYKLFRTRHVEFDKDSYIPKVKASWEDVAFCMGYDVYFVKAAKEQFSTLDKQCKQVFTDWLITSHGPTPKTWQTLLSKLKDIDDLKKRTYRAIQVM